MPGEYTQAEIVRMLNRIEAGQEALTQKVEDQRGVFVSRDAWTIKNLAFDREMVRLHERIDKTDKDAADSRAPWWTWATILTAMSALAINIIPKLAT